MVVAVEHEVDRTNRTQYVLNPQTKSMVESNRVESNQPMSNRLNTVEQLFL